MMTTTEQQGVLPDTGKEITTEAQTAASLVLENHMTRDPDAVIILSIKNGIARIDITQFPSIADVAFCQKVINKKLDEAFYSSVNP